MIINNMTKIVLGFLITILVFGTIIYVKNMNPLVVDGFVKIRLSEYSNAYYIRYGTTNNKDAQSYHDVLESMIFNKIISKELKNIDISPHSVDDEMLDEMIQLTPEFCNEDKSFNEEYFKQFLKISGKTLSDYKLELKETLLFQYFIQAILNKQINDSHSHNILKALKQVRHFKVLYINPKEFILDNEININEEDMHLFYTTNKEKFIVTGRRKVLITKIPNDKKGDVQNFINNNYYNFEILSEKFNLENTVELFIDKNNSKALNNISIFKNINHSNLINFIMLNAVDDTYIYENNNEFFIVKIESETLNHFANYEDVKDKVREEYIIYKKIIKLQETALNIKNENKSDMAIKITQAFKKITDINKITYNADIDSQTVFSLNEQNAISYYKDGKNNIIFVQLVSIINPNANNEHEIINSNTHTDIKQFNKQIKHLQASALHALLKDLYKEKYTIKYNKIPQISKNNTYNSDQN